MKRKHEMKTIVVRREFRFKKGGSGNTGRRIVRIHNIIYIGHLTYKSAGNFVGGD
jgi:hypothetical protein